MRVYGVDALVGLLRRVRGRWMRKTGGNKRKYQDADDPATNHQDATQGKGEETGDLRYFLMKSEPDVFSIDDLAGSPNQTNIWEGVRNFQARNIMRDQMREGDLALFYHSNTKAKATGIIGTMEIVKTAYTDHTQFDKKSEYYDSSCVKDKPKWLMVDVKLREVFEETITLQSLKTYSNGPLRDMVLFKNSRLSVQPVTKEEWDFIMALAKGK